LLCAFIIVVNNYILDIAKPNIFFMDFEIFVNKDYNALCNIYIKNYT